MTSRDRAAALALLALGVAGTLMASRLTIGTPARPGPGFFPFWLGLGLGLVALALLLLRSPAAAPHSTAAPSPCPLPLGGGEGNALAERPRAGKVAVILIATAGYAALLEPLGFVVTTFLFLAFLLAVVEPRPWRSVLVISAATSLACHVVFKVWLNVQLPAGAWGF